nr:hypothetical protein CFP56_65860 [Quercus suber]
MRSQHVDPTSASDSQDDLSDRYTQVVLPLLLHRRMNPEVCFHTSSTECNAECDHVARRRRHHSAEVTRGYRRGTPRSHA